MKRDPSIRVLSNTHRVTITALPFCTGDCRAGRAPCTCATGQTELANAIPIDKELPKVKSSTNYRTHSGAWKGLAPRTTEERWPSPPVSIEPGWFVRLVRRILGR